MADAELIAPMPALELTQGEVLKLEARDPTTGAEIAGVVCTDFVIYATQSENDDPGTLTLENIYLTPRAGDVIRPDPIDGRGD